MKIARKLSIALFAGITVTMFLVLATPRETPVTLEKTAPAATTTTAPMPGIQYTTAPALSPHAPEASSSVLRVESAATTSITFPTAKVTIEGKVFDAPVRENENVFDIMETLRTEGVVSFTTRDYAGMGQMLLSINDKVSNGDLTWIFYVNGKESQKGVSSVKVSPGDVIEWKYEKAY